MQYPIVLSATELLKLNWREIDPSKEPGLSCIYQLVEKVTGALIYVGRSVRIGHRLSTDHPVYDPGIHKVIVLELPRNLLRFYEAIAIDLLNPLVNKRAGFYPQEAVSQLADAWWKEYSKTL